MPQQRRRKPPEKISIETIRIGLLAGHSQREIAKRGGVHPTTIEKKIQAARRQLGQSWPWRDEQQRAAVAKPTPDPAKPRHTGDVTPELGRKLALSTLVRVAEDDDARGADRVAAATALLRAFPETPAAAPALDAVDLLQEIDRATVDAEPDHGIPGSP